MRTERPGVGRHSLIALLVAAACAPSMRAQDLAAQTFSDAGTIDRVVIYPSGAAVTRAVHKDLAQGLWTVRVTNLPEGVDGAQLQAKVRSGDAPNPNGPRLLGVEFEETPGVEFAGSPEGVELANKLKDARRRLEHATQDRAQVEQRQARIDQVGIRAAANATADGGTAKADPAKALEQLAWANAEKTKALEESRAIAERAEAIGREIAQLETAIREHGGATRTQRTAVVKIAAPTAAPMDLDLTYLVPNAAWAPAYSIRAAGDRSGATVEYDALVAQRTGEEWKDVRVSLSTADPQRASQPGEVQPVYVDIEPDMPEIRYRGAYGSTADRGGQAFPRKNKAMPGKPGRSAGRPAEPGGGGYGTGGKDAEPADDAGAAQALAELAGAARVAEAGIAASFELPRRITVPSDGARKQRTRIATFEPGAKFVYGAQPLVTEDVFLRGELSNTSGYQLLPGTAQVFMGGDFIGETMVPSVAPKSDFRVYFGPDRAVRARREVLSRVTGAAGLFGGSIATTWKYRVTIDNGTGRDIAVELLDRRAMSRNEKIEIKIADVSSPLSTDAEYASGPAKTGILRWDIAVPASARGPAALPVTWTVQETHAKDIQVTTLPDLQAGKEVQP
jgi:hypothetical protein